MKEESHRVSEVCEKSVDKTTGRTARGRLDGHSLYSAEHAAGPRELQADPRALRPAARQLRRRRPLAEAGRRPAGPDDAGGARLARPTAAGQDCPPAARPGAAARVRPGLWLRRLQRRRPARGRSDPQAAAGPRSARRPGAGLAADPVALRERRAAVRFVSPPPGRGRGWAGRLPGGAPAPPAGEPRSTERRRATRPPGARNHAPRP